MPDPTFKIDSTTVLSKSGTTVSIDSGVTFPTGHVTNFISKMYEFTSSTKTYANDNYFRLPTLLVYEVVS